MTELREGILESVTECWSMSDAAGHVKTFNKRPTKEDALAFKDEHGITHADVEIDPVARTVIVRKKDVAGTEDELMGGLE